MMAEDSASQTFPTRAAARILAVSPARIRYWVKSLLVKPASMHGRQFRFAFRDLIALRQVKELLGRRRHLGPIRRYLDQIDQHLDASRPLALMRLADDEGRVLVHDGAMRFEADSGQLLLNFGAPASGAVDGRFTAARARELIQPAEGSEAAQPSQHARALALYASILEREPRNAKVRLEVAALLEASGDLDGALKHLLHAMTAEPANATIHLRLGLLHRRGKDSRSALLCFLRALEFDSDLAEAHRNCAELFEEMGRKRDALRHLSALDRLTRDP